jgi:hypothetical protein
MAQGSLSVVMAVVCWWSSTTNSEGLRPTLAVSAQVMGGQTAGWVRMRRVRSKPQTAHLSLAWVERHPTTGLETIRDLERPQQPRESAKAPSGGRRHPLRQDCAKGRPAVTARRR